MCGGGGREWKFNTPLRGGQEQIEEHRGKKKEEKIQNTEKAVMELMCLTLGHRFLDFFHSLLTLGLQRVLPVLVLSQQQIESNQLEGRSQGQHSLSRRQLGTQSSLSQLTTA